MAAVALAVGLSSFAFGSGEPPQPAWVGPNGVVDWSKVPARMPIANSHGKIIGYVNKEDMFTPPGHDQNPITIYKGPTGTQVTGLTTRRGDPPIGGPRVDPIVTSGVPSP